MRRSHNYTLRLDDDEDERLKKVARHLGLDVASMLRMLVKKEEERIAMERKSK